MPPIPEGKKTLYNIVPAELAEAIDQYRFKRQFRSVNAAVVHLLRYAVKANPPKPEEVK
jgi:hypothetical protein